MPVGTLLELFWEDLTGGMAYDHYTMAQDAIFLDTELYIVPKSGAGPAIGPEFRRPGFARKMFSTCHGTHG